MELTLPASPSGAQIAPNYGGEIALARLPRDRWGALGLWGDKETGSAWTIPVTLPKRSQLQINGSGLNGIRIEVGDESFGLLSNFKRGTGGRLDSGLARRTDRMGRPSTRRVGREDGAFPRHLHPLPDN